MIHSFRIVARIICHQTAIIHRFAIVPILSNWNCAKFMNSSSMIPKVRIHFFYWISKINTTKCVLKISRSGRSNKSSDPFAWLWLPSDWYGNFGRTSNGSNRICKFNIFARYQRHRVSAKRRFCNSSIQVMQSRPLVFPLSFGIPHAHRNAGYN